MLGAVGGKEKKLCQRVNLDLRIKQDCANAFAQGCAARLARLNDFEAAQAQFACEQS